MREVEEQPGDKNLYRKVAFKDKMFSQLVECTNWFLRILK